jgi:hypothetical protein
MVCPLASNAQVESIKHKKAKVRATIHKLALLLLEMGPFKYKYQQVLSLLTQTTARKISILINETHVEKLLWHVLQDGLVSHHQRLNAKCVTQARRVLLVP